MVIMLTLYIHVLNYTYIYVRTVCVVDKSEASVIVSVLFQPAM